MSSPLLLDIVTYLTAHAVVDGDGIDAFRDFTPEEPDSVVVLTEYPGSPSVPYETAVHRSVQVSVRDKSADRARSKALEIHKLLQSENSIVVFTPERWGQVTLRQTPFRLSTDTLDRVTYAFNFGITTTIE